MFDCVYYNVFSKVSWSNVQGRALANVYTR